jgi:hypothetical protein
VNVSECILNPGDSIFIPSGYWHLMTYLDSGFSVSYRKMAQRHKLIANALLNLLIFLPIDKFLIKLSPTRWQEMKEEIAQRRAGELLNQSDKLSVM